jgi:hypothetical protein
VAKHEIETLVGLFDELTPVWASRTWNLSPVKGIACAPSDGLVVTT